MISLLVSNRNGSVFESMRERFNIGCTLEVEDIKKFNGLMQIYKKGSYGRFYNADLLRECIRFTWENKEKLKLIQLENSKLKEVVNKQKEELFKQDNKIKQALKSLQ